MPSGPVHQRVRWRVFATVRNRSEGVLGGRSSDRRAAPGPDGVIGRCVAGACRCSGHGARKEDPERDLPVNRSATMSSYERKPWYLWESVRRPPEALGGARGGVFGGGLAGAVIAGVRTTGGPARRAPTAAVDAPAYRNLPNFLVESGSANTYNELEASISVANA
jgi:hypothetical protein